jgi:hypothetical protein
MAVPMQERNPPEVWEDDATFRMLILMLRHSNELSSLDL